MQIRPSSFAGPLAVALVALAVAGCDGTAPRSETATFRVTFAGTWEPQLVPVDGSEGVRDLRPANAHFSRLVTVAHTRGVDVWSIGALATPGLEAVAERGQTDRIRDEVAAFAGSATYAESDTGTGAEGVMRVVIEASSRHARLTALTMIAPSPDWFVGVDGFSLVEDDDWIDERVLSLRAIDAGTDAGRVFSQPDEPDEARPVAEATILDWEGYRFGTLTIERID